MKFNRVLQGDVLGKLHFIPEQAIGMVLTEPPIFCGFDRDSESPNDVSRIRSTDPWSEIESIDTAAAWGEHLMRQFRRITRPGGAVVFLADPRASAAWMHAAENVGLIYMAQLVVLWDGGTSRERSFGSAHSNILWFTVPGARHSWNNEQRSLPSNILVCNRVPREVKAHPAQKPLELSNFLVSLLSRPDDVILDPFCGSGTVLVSAELCGRPWLGIDHDEEWAKLSRRRINHAEVEDQGELFMWLNGELIPL